jgi:hypothetical protein
MDHVSTLEALHDHETMPDQEVTPDQEPLKEVEAQDCSTENMFDMLTPNYVSSLDMKNYVIEDEEESAGKNNLFGRANAIVG